jgi:hypothetical protein
MNNIKLAIALIGTGLSIAFVSLSYVHANFTSKETSEIIKEDVKYIRSRSDKIIELLLKR